MNEGWLELESDPGLFTLLVEEFGVRGVQVEEIYDLQKPIEGPVFGFIFLFKWIEERRARRKMSPSDEAFVSDAEVVNSMFFAQQIVPNSCATHALLSVLLNCSDINLGQTLLSLKTFSKNFTPESKGYAIGNVAQIAKVHNSHAHPEPKKVKEKQSGITTTNRNHEAFHFVSYVPINGRLFELDGLKPYPIDHGPWGDHEEWTEKFRRVIAERLDNEGGSSDIRFNLMAVVADRRLAYEQRLGTLRANKQIILDALEQLMHVNRPHVTHHGKGQQTNQVAKKSHEEKQTKLAAENAKVSEPASSNQPQAKVVSELTSSNDAPGKTESSEESTGSNKEGIDAKKEENEEEEVIEIDDSGEQKDEQNKKKKKTTKVKIKTAVIPQPYRLPAALDNHNYAKSPLESDEEQEESSSEYITESDTEETDGKSLSTGSSSSTSGSRSSSETDTDSESSSEDKTEGESDAVQSEDSHMADLSQDKSDENKAVPQPEAAEVKAEEKVSEPEPELPPPPKTEGILKKQGADASEKSDSPALRVTFSDAHEEKEVNDDDDDDDIEIIDSTVPADITKPLTIQTVFENGPPSPASSNYSTDTASEAGSAFNSPIRSANHSRSVSPNSVKQLKFKEWKSNVISEARAKLEATILEMDQKDSVAAANAKKTPPAVVSREGAHMGTRSKVARAAAATVPQTRQSAAKRLTEQTGKKAGYDGKSNLGVTESDRISKSGYSIPMDTWKPPRPSFLVSQNGKQPFAPRDLLELLKSVEAEVEIYEQKLEDEMEKRHKYKIDDCRRTHNYDPFICTFLTMLAEQGKLSALVEKHTIIKRRQGISLGQLQKSRKRDRRRSRPRPKKTTKLK